jgi:S1-C subfamily serine protease
MRLYSRGQVIFFSIISCLLTALIVAGAGKLAKNRADPQYKTVQETVIDGVPNDVVQVLEAELRENAPRPIEIQSASSFSEDERENISVYERLNAAVVNITTETMAVNWFLEPVPQEGGSGSGSIIDARGYVLTNNHVIQNAYKVYINLADGSQYEGTVIGTDPENDLAVVKFDPPAGTELRTVPYGDSEGLKVGQKVLAIGNPFAMERTLTVGIVSGLGRPIQITRTPYIVKDMIQTDASINPGNSGGPLLDSRGRMIGITTIIFSPSGGSVGIGFAVPVNTAKRVVNELRQYGKVRRGWIDMTPVQLFPELVRYAKLPVASGLLVSRIKRGGLADRAGLKQGSEPVQYRRTTIYLGGDIITSVNGMKIAVLSDLYSALEHSKPGDKVKVGILRGDTNLTLEIQLADREEVMNN